MAAKIIDGVKIAGEIRGEISAGIKKLREENGIVPGLAVMLVGDDPASQTYVRNKGKACEQLGIFSETLRLPADAPESKVLEIVGKWNADPKFHGILVQTPLPAQVSEWKVLNAISPMKDVDCFHPANVGKVLIGEPDFLPCTPAGVQQLLIRSGYSPEGKHVVICGRSNLVGKPLAAMLVQKKPGANATVTVCHTGTKDMAHFTRQADILVAAAGSPKMITAGMVKEGAVVIDVGTSRVDAPGTKSGYRLSGDVDFDAVKEKVEAISPVPGGVGPMTITMLLANTLKAAKMGAGQH